MCSLTPTMEAPERLLFAITILPSRQNTLTTRFVLVSRFAPPVLGTIAGGIRLFCAATSRNSIKGLGVSASFTR